MNVFYEEEGDFKVGAILADNNTSLQVESPHGKRGKIKTSNVLFRFEGSLARFMEEAARMSADIDLDLLWECSPQQELSYETVAQDYYGHAPSHLESAALLLRMHGAPMYFYRKGRGRYRPAPPEALKAALASVERKRQQALLQASYVEQLLEGKLPEALRPLVQTMLYRPDRNTIEVKALEEAALKAKSSPAVIMLRCGGVASAHDYHFDRFLFEHFPQGIQFDAALDPAFDPQTLPLAPVLAFSIDDVTTTEIDDAFSVRPLPGGHVEIGIHIAAPAFGVAVGGAVDAEAARRLSTVYMPGRKITMLPEPIIERFTLGEGRQCPVISLYAQVDGQWNTVSTRSVPERVTIAANLRHDDLESWFNEATLQAGLPAKPHAEALACLYGYACHLEVLRGRSETTRPINMDYSFYVDNDRVRIVERVRGSPIDRLVSEMMILVNSTWGQVLADHRVPAIYRSQSGGKVKMSTVPAEHQGLGVAQYAWASSPIRRYVDLLNQRQLLAHLSGRSLPYGKTEDLFIHMRDFELAYDAYAEFQRQMERYWCLRWLEQEKIRITEAQVFKEDVVKVAHIPLLTRLPGLPSMPAGSVIPVEVSDIDLLALSFHLELLGKR